MLQDLLAAGAVPIVAILRGITPPEALAIGTALVQAGIRFIEVPLNSPDPFASIALLSEALGQDNLIGAGTVLDPQAVDAVQQAGGRLIVTPNTNQAVIAHAVGKGLVTLPGFATPTEAFAALAAGATNLKLFPAASLGPAHLAAIREVVPRTVGLWAVGGTNVETARAWRQAGAAGMGVGGALYRPGDTAAEVGLRAAALAQAWRAAG